MCFKFSLYPENSFKRKKPKEETPPEEEQPKKEEPPKDDTSASPKENIIKKFYNTQGFDGTVTFIKDIVRVLNGFFRDIFTKAFVIEKLFLQMYVAKGDAAETAIAYGKTCAAAYPALGYICETMRVRRYDADISVDYLAKKSTAMINFTLSVRPIRVTNAVVKLGVKALMAYLKARKRGKIRTEQLATQASTVAASENQSVN